MKKNNHEIQKIKTKILKLGLAVPGTIRTVYLRCGKENCKCRSDKKEDRHGPYTFWDRKLNKKLASKSVDGKDLKNLQMWINNRRKLGKLVKQLLTEGVKIANLLSKGGN